MMRYSGPVTALALRVPVTEELCVRTGLQAEAGCKTVWAARLAVRASDAASLPAARPG